MLNTVRVCRNTNKRVVNVRVAIVRLDTACALYTLYKTVAPFISIFLRQRLALDLAARVHYLGLASVFVTGVLGISLT